DPADKDGIREALMQAFRLRGIFPNGARFFSEDALTWTRGDDLDLPRLAGLHFGDPNGLTCEDKSRIAPVLHGYLDDPTVRARLGLDVDLPLDVPSFHPVFRRHGDGSLRRDMRVQAGQPRRLRVDGNAKISYPYRAGATLLIEPERDGPAGSAGAHVRWVIAKPMYTPGKRGNAEAAERHARQQAYLASQDLTGDIGVEHLHIDFGLVHGGMGPMPKKKTTTNGAGGAGIRIRMYRVGFGDFFLVTLATAKGEQHIVIDCGVFKGTSGTGDIGSIEAAIANLAKVTRRELALVIMTHRHADHIAGFGRFAEEFRRFKVGAVWMPIWEEEYGEAKKLQAEVTALAEEVQAHLDRRLAATGETDHELYHRVGNVTGIEPAAAAARKPNGKAGRTSMNAIALDLLKTGWSVKPQYLKTNDTPVLPPALAA